MIDVQYRAKDVVFHERSDDDGFRIEGYFVVYDDETMLWDGVYEKIDRHAFDGQLGKDIRALVGHNSEKVLGRVKNNTLKLKSDDKGLWGSILINKDDPEAFSLYQKVKRGDVDKCSFGFIPTEEECVKRDDSDLFIVKKCDLVEVSVVAFPAYENTSISARKKDFDKKRLCKMKDDLKEKLNVIKNINA